MHLNSRFHFFAFAILLSSPLAVKGANAEEQPGSSRQNNQRVEITPLDRYVYHNEHALHEIRQRMNALHAQIHYRTRTLAEEARRNREETSRLTIENTHLKLDLRALQSRVETSEAISNHTRALVGAVVLRLTILEQRLQQSAQQPAYAAIAQQQPVQQPVRLAIREHSRPAQPSAPVTIAGPRQPRVQPSVTSRTFNPRPFPPKK
jgi:lipopolysaccharide biosynthesis regulator YciM